MAKGSVSRDAKMQRWQLCRTRQVTRARSQSLLGWGLRGQHGPLGCVLKLVVSRLPDVTVVGGQRTKQAKEAILGSSWGFPSPALLSQFPLVLLHIFPVKASMAAHKH